MQGEPCGALAGARGATVKGPENMSAGDQQALCWTLAVSHHLEIVP